MTVVEDAFDYLGELPISYLATSVDDQPYVRAMMLIHREKKLYYATFSGDRKVAEIKANPKVEVCVLLGEGDNGGSLRMRGVVEFVDDQQVRAEVHGSVDFIQRFWGDPTNPEYVLIEFKPSYLELMRPGTMDIEKADI